MTKEKAEKIIKIVNWIKFLILVAFLTLLYVGLVQAQPFASNVPRLEQKELAMGSEQLKASLRP